MKEHLSFILKTKRNNMRRLKAELFKASGDTQAIMMNAIIKEQSQINHILYLGTTY